MLSEAVNCRKSPTLVFGQPFHCIDSLYCKHMLFNLIGTLTLFFYLIHVLLHIHPFTLRSFVPYRAVGPLHRVPVASDARFLRGRPIYSELRDQSITWIVPKLRTALSVDPPPPWLVQQDTQGPEYYERTADRAACSRTIQHVGED